MNRMSRLTLVIMFGKMMESGLQQQECVSTTGIDHRTKDETTYEHTTLDPRLEGEDRGYERSIANKDSRHKSHDQIDIKAQRDSSKKLESRIRNNHLSIPFYGTAGALNQNRGK